jgi:predicted peptidase
MFSVEVLCGIVIILTFRLYFLFMKKNLFLPISIIFLSFATILVSCKNANNDPRYKVVQLTEPDSAMQVKLNGIKALDVVMTMQYAFSYTGKNNQQIWCRLIEPPTDNPDSPDRQKKKYPLVIVLHGSGAIGTNNIKQMGVLAKMWAISYIRSRYPAYVLVPQFSERSSDYVTDQARGVLTSKPRPCLNTLLELIDSMKLQKDIDSNRIYVMGFSMGGSTALNAISLRPYLFAAGVSFSGIPNFDGEATFLKTPLWIIHGNADAENPFASDSLLYKELKAKGASGLLFWEMDKMGHEVPKQLYADTSVPAWLFSKRKTPLSP